MASASICSACRLILRAQIPQVRHIRSRNPLSPGRSLRLLTTTPNISAEQPQPHPYKAKRTSAPASSASAAISEVAPSDDANPNSPHPSASSSATNPARAVAKELRKRASSVTETYVAYGACENLVKECARQADYSIPQAHEKGVEVPKTKDGEDLGVGSGWWFETLGLTPTFNTWAQITFLHMYLLTVRLRMFPPEHASIWHQHLLDHFFFLAEDRMVTTHNMAARSVRNKYLKDLFVQWRGLMAGYDEGLVKGDAVLATAVWRNIFKGDENVDFRGVGEIVSYIRGVLQGLEGMNDEGVASGEMVFGDPETERDGVLVKSRLMDAPGQLAGGTVQAGGKAKTVSDPSDVV